MLEKLANFLEDSLKLFLLLQAFLMVHQILLCLKEANPRQPRLQLVVLERILEGPWALPLWSFHYQSYPSGYPSLSQGFDLFPQVARAGEEVVDRRGGRPPELLGRELRGPLAEDVLGRAAAGGGEA